ncbi:acetyl-CoA carboxylase biotin carboxyl carrier protein subunit [Candidatus Bathyarchaeota archaeon]|nr:acetyl-CoA carboxylase biotin carboxyl carrier protein subunit [Candidatus Bathyarchaeota archaeon]
MAERESTEVTFKPEAALKKLEPIQIQKKELVKEVGEEAVIKAPMDGTITRIEKKLGDKVSVGEVVLVLEAMKMENEICAPKSGIIKELNASKGVSVHQGDVLAVIE